MTAKIIDGKKIASEILSEIKAEIVNKDLKLKLDIIQVGDEEATTIYVRNKVKKAAEVGIETEIHKLETTVTYEEFSKLIKKLNEDSKVTGFFIQTPIPRHLDLLKLVAEIDYKKDVDGMNPYNLGGLMQGRRDILVSATALACYFALKYTSEIELPGKHVVIVGRSLILGKPLAALLLGKDCTVTVCHTKTQNLKELCQTADILVTGTGQEKLITKEFLKDGAIVVDCGAPKAEVDFESVKELASYITPVPGGIGPLTIAGLLRNCVKAKTDII